MKRACIFSFSERGCALAGRIEALLADGWQTEALRVSGGLTEAVRARFGAADALIFVGACGIAVRAIAPCLAGKTLDPAVVVLDERGKYVISLLSGHIGGANALAAQIASGIGGECVVTTATDVNHRFSVDAWAAKAGHYIDSMAAARRISAGILKEDIPVSSDYPLPERLPDGLTACETGELGIRISCRTDRPYRDTLLIVPGRLHLGLGMRRGTTARQLEDAVARVLAENGLHPRALAGAASIDVKADEAGLIEFCEAGQLPLHFYTAEELRALGGGFTASAFVEKTVGVDNVCERSALRDAGEGARLLVKKTAGDGITVAVATENWRVSF